MIVRPLEEIDAPSSARLGQEAFGSSASASTTTVEVPGGSYLGTFDDDTLVARLLTRQYESWIGGRALSTCGIAGVAVQAEQRGSGLLRPLLTSALGRARATGAVISTLYPTAPAIYRGFGYEIVSELLDVRLPTRSLADVPAPHDVTTRRARTSDLEQVRSLYDVWAAGQDGPLTRRGPSFVTPDEDLLASVTGMTLAVDATGVVVGVVTWQRGHGYGADSTIRVLDLIATRVDAYRALLRVIGSHAPVAPTTRLRTSGADPVRLLLRSADWVVAASDPYMLRVLDVPAAFARRAYAPFDTDVTFRVEDDVLTANTGTYRLSVRGGVATCEPVTDPDAPLITVQGLALLLVGAHPCSDLRALGHVTGGHTADDPRWDAMVGGRQTHVRDYF